MLSCARQRGITHPPCSYLSLPLSITSSIRSFHSSPPSEHKTTRQKLAKEKATERYHKIVRKREIKGLEEQRDKVKQERAYQEQQRRIVEVKEKQVVAQEIVESLPPLSEEQLESMYRGLISALPEELALNAIEQSKAPALPDPTVETYERQDRLVALSERLDEVEEEEVERDVIGETLTERLRRKRVGETELEKVEEKKTGLEVREVSSPAVSLLSRVEKLVKDVPLVPQASTSTAGLAASLPKGLLARSEWTDLVLACAQEGDIEAVIRGLRAMESTVPLTDGKVLEDILALYASEGRPQDAVKLTDFARQNSLPLSVTAHHHLLTSLLPSHPELAVQHLHSMEALGYTPLPSTYTSIVSRLLSPSSPPALIRKGWDLYAHSRLVSHPVPSVELYSTMIQACSRGSHPSPERAIDLFTELTDDNRLPPSELAYNGVIRACSREGSQEYYYEALRFMRKMLDENVEPSRYTFHALLEGAKRHGDLARARWMLVKMVGVAGKVAPDQNTVGLVFQTYAAFRPEGGKRREREKVRVREVEEEGRPSTILKAEQDPTNLPLSSPITSREDAGPLALIELLGESSLFYPGPLPQTSSQVLLEAQNLMLQIVGPHALSLLPSTPSPSTSMFPEVKPSTFLLNAYLSILNSHSTLSASLEIFNAAFDTTGVEKNRYTFELVMKRCEVGRVGKEEVEKTKEVFEEWLRWSSEECPAVQELRERKDEGEAVEEMELERVGREAREWEKERRNGRNVSKMWGGLIRVLAKGYQESEALSVLLRFNTLYPASNVANFRPTSSSLPTPDTSVTRVPLQLSSSLYPETSPSLISSLPPYLTFQDLKLLHLRFVELEDKKGLGYVKGISKGYEAGLAHFRNWEKKMGGKS